MSFRRPCLFPFRNQKIKMKKKWKNVFYRQKKSWLDFHWSIKIDRWRDRPWAEPWWIVNIRKMCKRHRGAGKLNQVLTFLIVVLGRLCWVDFLLLLNPVKVEALGEHYSLQVFIFFLLPESLLLQESHQRVPLLHHLQHLIQDPLLLGQLCLSLQVVYKREKCTRNIFTREFPVGKL